MNHYPAGGREKTLLIENQNAGVLRKSQFICCRAHYGHNPISDLRHPKPLLQFAKPPIDASHRLYASFAALSNSATRASISSSSIALAACVRILSAALTRVEAGVPASTMTLSKVVAAAAAPCCSRAID